MPLEMLGRTRFPRDRRTALLITLAPYGFFWFQLQERDKSSRTVPRRAANSRPWWCRLARPGCRWRAPAACSSATCCRAFLPRPPLVCREALAANCHQAARSAVPLRSSATNRPWLAVIRGRTQRGRHGRYVLPLHDRLGALRPRALRSARAWPRCARARAKAPCSMSRPSRDFIALLLSKICAERDGREAEQSMRLEFRPTAASPTRRSTTSSTSARSRREQSNTTALVDNRLCRQDLSQARQPASIPEIEIGRFLTEVARLCTTRRRCSAASNWSRATTASALAVVHAFVENQGDAWTVTSAYLDRFVDEQRLLPATNVAGEATSSAAYLQRMRRSADATPRCISRLRVATTDAGFRAGADRRRGRRSAGSTMRRCRAPSASSTTCCERRDAADGSRLGARPTAAGARATPSWRTSSSLADRSLSTASRSATMAISISARC